MKFRKRVAHIEYRRDFAEREAQKFIYNLKLEGIHPLKYVPNTNPILVHFGEEEHLFFSLNFGKEGEKLCGYTFDEIIPNNPRYAHCLSPQGRNQYVQYD